MAKPTFFDVKAAVNDLLTRNDFVIHFGVTPGSGFSLGREVELKCIAVSLPEIEINVITTTNRGFTRTDRGIKKFGSNTFTCDFFVKDNSDTIQFIYNWMEFASGTNSGQSEQGKKKYFSALTGNAAFDNLDTTALGLPANPNIVDNSKTAYSQDNVVLNLLNIKGDLAVRFSLFGVFPIKLSGFEFANDRVEKELLRITGTFALDYYTIDDILTTTALNLGNQAVDKLVGALPGNVKSTANSISKLF